MKAARCPRPTACAMSSAPDTTSPAAKTYGTSVCSVPGSAWIVPFAAVSSRGARVAASGLSPIAAITISQAITNSLPGTGSGRRRPEASGAPSSVRTQRSPLTRPCPSPTTSTGATWKLNLVPSCSAASTSSG